VTALLHCIGDFERISDHARNLKEAAREMQTKKISFSRQAGRELEVLKRAVSDMLRITMQGFAQEDQKLASRVEPLEEVIDDLSREVRQRHIRRLKNGSCTIELGFVLSDITTDLERVADHCSNIAVSLSQEAGDEMEPHAYLYSLKEDRAAFESRVAECRASYCLPKPDQVSE
jgi:phosphate:Na+ symporter